MRQLGDNQTFRIRAIRETGRLPPLDLLFEGEDKTDQEIITWIQEKTEEEFSELLDILNNLTQALYNDYKKSNKMLK